ncbi:hypothetical protein DASC09_035090 [Saccharomycopsis crataegensis]|uniref:Uncharacterized protein n=1 Tax=Saccharomycopsis crataegensis TaxID=43959 RepID=A0AAV5QND9_9ASCO|nr:hypothetical protein DASC09_035090 [Saccharomycopsis crataegensis]
MLCIVIECFWHVYFKRDEQANVNSVKSKSTVNIYCSKSNFSNLDFSQSLEDLGLSRHQSEVKFTLPMI